MKIGTNSFFQIIAFCFLLMVVQSTAYSGEFDTLKACEVNSDCMLVDSYCYKIESINKSKYQEYLAKMKTTKVRCGTITNVQWKEYYKPGCDDKKCVAKSINSKRKKEVPSDILKACGFGEIADRHDPYNFSDVGDSRPTTRLNLACHYKDDSWYIYCERGGYAVQHLQFKFTKDSGGKWIKSDLKATKSEALAECPEF
ncbi:hypothetical protein ACLVWU_08705 [Bdellovibrio sp. HCB290]|uniref:hypothetical protein n=1 Tax=Bdellovibrio sp. HCB290 TaxID=3394356 RepID=UPI0039B4A876